MRHTKTTKAMALMLSLVMITSVFVGNTLSRYVTSVSSTDSARVAVWGINGEETQMNLFDTKYIKDGKEIAKANNGTDKIIAPGTEGEAEFNIINFEQNVAPEVSYEVKISLDDSEIHETIKNNPSVQWKLDNGAFGTWNELKTAILSLSGNAAGRYVYGPGEFATAFQGTQEHKIAWQWLMDNSNNVMDTEMGNLALTNDLNAVIKVSITAQQVDDLITNEYILDGADQTVNLNDIEPITIRSSADFSTFEGVEVNGNLLTRDVDYTAEEGSTVITLTEEYLSKLSVGTYTIDIISNDVTAITKFNIIDKDIRKVSGSYLNLNDVSSDVHKLDIKLTSDTVTDFSGVTVTRVGQNLLDIDSMVNAINPNTGNLYDNGDGTYTLSKVGNSRFSAFTDVFIPQGSILKPSAVLVNESAEGDAEKLKIGFRGADPSTQAVWLSAAGLGSIPANYSIPFDVVEIYLCIDGTEGTFVTFKNMQIAINVDNPPKYQAYDKKTVVANSDGTVTGVTSIAPTMLLYTNSKDVEIECKYMSIKEQIIYDLSDKVIVNFGDSIFGNNQPTMDISTYIKDLTNANVYNAGFGGTRMGTHIEYYDDFSMDSLANAIVTSDFSTQKSAINNFDSFPTYYANTVSMLENLDFNNVDIITIAHGTNDFTGGNSLDEVSTALRYSIETLQAKYPNLKIVLCSPIYRFWTNDNNEFVNDSDTKTNTYGEKLSDYSAVYESIANEYGVYFIDNYNYSGINASNRNNAFPINDSTHPNSYGRELIAENMAKELYNYFK